MDTWTHGLLPENYWEGASALERNIAVAVLAYAAGDAFGVQFEFLPKVTGEIIHKLAVKEDWPLGGVSDDTLLSMLTIKCLADKHLADVGKNFLTLLKNELPNLRGLGPTTRSVLGLPVKTTEKSQIGLTNGGMMRTALSGLAFDPVNKEERRAWITALTFATHKDPCAMSCALLMSAAFSAATTPKNSLSLLEVLLEEANSYEVITEEVRKGLLNFKSWVPPESGISLNPLETLLAVLWVVTSAINCRDVYSRACKLGGDTDTVAALSGALYCSWHPDENNFFAIEWLPEVRWQEVTEMQNSIQILINRRLGKYNRGNQ